MFYSSPTSNITPALVSVAMSRSDSRDSNYSAASDRSHHFTSAPMTVSYSSLPFQQSQYSLGRITSNASTSSNTSHRASSQSIRRDSSSTWISSPYRSCQLQGFEEPSSYLSDDDLLYTAPARAESHRMPVNSITNMATSHMYKKELTTEEQIAMMREMQDKEQDDQMHLQMQRRHAAAAAQKAVRFAAEQRPRRPSYPRRRAAQPVRKSSLNGPQ